MKRLILPLFLLFLVLSINAQEIILNAPITTTAGTRINYGELSIAKWRIGEVHLIVLDQKDEIEEVHALWEVTAYPNPFKESLNVRFNIPDKNEISIQVTDLSGKKQFISQKQEVFSKQVISLNLANLASGFYLLSVMLTNEKTAQIIKIQKI